MSSTSQLCATTAEADGKQAASRSAFTPPTTEPSQHAGDACSPLMNDEQGEITSFKILSTALRLPIILDEILQSTEEANDLGEGLRSAAWQRSPSELLRIRLFADTLCRTCDDVCKAHSYFPRHDHEEKARDGKARGVEATEEVDGFGAFCDEESHVNTSQTGAPDNNPCEVEDGDNDAGDFQHGKDARTDKVYVDDPNSGVETRRGDIPEPEEVVGTALQVYEAGRHGVSSPERCTDTRQSHWRGHSDPEPQPISVEDGIGELAPGTPTDIAPTFSTDYKAGAGAGAGVSSTACSMSGSTIISSPQSARAAASGKKSSPLKVREPTLEDHADGGGKGCLYLLEQSVESFVTDSYEQVQQHTGIEDVTETYATLFDALQNGRDESRLSWSNGTEWVSLLEAGDRGRLRSSLRYALTAIGFSRWHESQTVLLEESNARTAAEKVSRRLIGFKPEDDKKRWEQKRKKLSTHLARGRKWSRLVRAFDFGILFCNPWQLAKSTESALERLFSEMPKSLEKMTLLRIMTSQMKLLLKTGKTDPDTFCNELDKHLPGFVPKAPPSTDDAEDGEDGDANAFARQVRRPSPIGKLLVPRTDFKIHVDSLKRLDGTRCLNDSIILACLHVADRLPFVRVGVSIPIHQQKRTNVPIQRPFERAGKQIIKWGSDLETPIDLVCFFPLLQHDNHFSLLEINERERVIYHYDSMGEVENSDIKSACGKEFPSFQYMEKVALRQNDGHSCGPIVIRHARWRMLGREVASEVIDGKGAKALRQQALALLQSAWENGGLVSATRSSPRKRGLAEKNQPKPCKRRKLPV